MDPRLRFVKDLIGPPKVPSGNPVDLTRDFNPGYVDKSVLRTEAEALLLQGIEVLGHYQERLAAHDSCGVLLVLQGMDGSGKDSSIKHVMSGVNPQGVEVHSFKSPSMEDC